MIFPVYPGEPLKKGSQGRNVAIMQDAMNKIFVQYPVADKICDEPNFGIKTEKAVMQLQQATNITQDGIIDSKTWNMILAIANLICDS